MTVFVTDLTPVSPGGGVRWARLWADTERELDLAAAVLGLHPVRRIDAVPARHAYYRITAAQRAAALTGGARALRTLPALPTMPSTPSLRTRRTIPASGGS